MILILLSLIGCDIARPVNNISSDIYTNTFDNQTDTVSDLSNNSDTRNTIDTIDTAAEATQDWHNIPTENIFR